MRYIVAMTARTNRFFALALIIGTVLAGSAPARRAAAQTIEQIPFVAYGSYYSKEMDLADAVDPQVFVADEHTQAGVGLQQIQHIEHLRPARLKDPASSILYTAQGQSLGVTLDKWTAAEGKIFLHPRFRRKRYRRARLYQPRRLRQLYDLDRGRHSSGSLILKPLGAKGALTSSQLGNASLTLHVPKLEPGDAVVLAFRSDEFDPNSQVLQYGIDTHEQLIAIIPSAPPRRAKVPIKNEDPEVRLGRYR